MAANKGGAHASQGNHIFVQSRNRLYKAASDSMAYCATQVFRRPVGECQQGDRAGICVTQLDPGSIERGLACEPGTVPTFKGAIASVEKVRFYNGPISSKSKVQLLPIEVRTIPCMR